MTTSVMTYTGRLVVVECYTCSTSYAIPESLNTKARKNPSLSKSPTSVYCPLGHSWWYLGETEAQKLKRQLNWAQDEAARVKAERDQAEASRRAWKGQATKLRNRAAAGDCPFCGEHVYQLARHVRRKHADEVAADPETEPQP